MDSQILYLIIGVLVGAIAIYFFVKKNGSSGDNSVLSSQLADLIVRFSKVEEATKNISSTQASIDNTFKSFEGIGSCKTQAPGFSADFGVTQRSGSGVLKGRLAPSVIYTTAAGLRSEESLIWGHCLESQTVGQSHPPSPKFMA